MPFLPDVTRMGIGVEGVNLVNIPGIPLQNGVEPPGTVFSGPPYIYVGGRSGGQRLAYIWYERIVFGMLNTHGHVQGVLQYVPGTVLPQVTLNKIIAVRVSIQKGIHSFDYVCVLFFFEIDIEPSSVNILGVIGVILFNPVIGFQQVGGGVLKKDRGNVTLCSRCPRPP